MFNIVARAWMSLWRFLPAVSAPSKAIIVGAIAWPTWHGVWNWLFGQSRENQLVPIPGVTNATVALLALAGVTYLAMRARRR